MTGKSRAPALELLLLTICHFWQLWQYVTILVALMPLVYPAWWKRNVFLSTITHCVLNLLGGLATAALILGTQAR